MTCCRPYAAYAHKSKPKLVIRSDIRHSDIVIHDYSVGFQIQIRLFLLALNSAVQPSGIGPSRPALRAALAEGNTPNSRISAPISSDSAKKTCSSPNNVLTSLSIHLDPVIIMFSIVMLFQNPAPVFFQILFCISFKLS